MFYVSAWFYSLIWLGAPIYIGPFVDEQACYESRRAPGHDPQAGECFEGLDQRAYAQGGINELDLLAVGRLVGSERTRRITLRRPEHDGG